MRLSLYTDLSLRTLIYLAGKSDVGPVSTPAIAERYGVSIHHLQKAVNGLRKLGYVRSTLGRSGGLELAVPAHTLKIGSLVAKLESRGCLVDCLRGPCPLAGACLLKVALDSAENAFFAKLDEYTLADMVRGATLRALRRLMA